MSSIERHITDQSSYDDALDRMVDRGDMSYDDARRILPSSFESPQEMVHKNEVEIEEPLHRPGRAMGTTAVLSSGERRVRRAVARGPQYGEEEGDGYPGGEPHYSRPVQDVFKVWDDPVQQATSKNGSAEVRAEMGWPSKDETHQ